VKTPGAFNGLSQLKAVAQQIKADAQVREAEAAALKARARKAQLEHRLFELAVGPVKPLAQTNKLVPSPEAPSPRARQRERDDLAVMVESISDEFDVGTLLETDDMLSYRRPGVGPDVLRKLRQGHWSIQAQLDLHGLRREEAREALSHFMRDIHRRGLRCVRIVHGKGLGSPGKTPVLKGRVQSWLIQKTNVIAFVQAKASEGGAGALLVLLDAQIG
jgi:DNA-nicking Smr family endonuclease